MKDKVFLEDIGLLHQFIKKSFKHYSQVSTECELNGTQAKVILAVFQNQDNTMKKISEIVGLEKGSFTTVVDSLIEKGCLVRVRSEQDRRIIMLQLTSKGESIAQELKQNMGRHMCELFKNVEPESLEQVKEAVHVLAEFVKKIEK